MAQVRESVIQEKALKVTGGVIEGGKLIGNASVNGRQYGDPVIAEGISRYNGAKVYLNHPAERTPGDRDFNDWVGVVENAKARRGGGFGDIRLRQEHPRFKEICEAVEHFPKHFGLSHVADIDSEKRGAVEHVTRIGEVFSVDIVTDPATTNGIFESKTTMKKQTLKQVLESTKGSQSVFRKVIAEMVEAGAMPETTEVAIADNAGEDESIKAGIMAAIAKKLESATPDELKKVLKALAIGDSVSDLVAGGNAPAPDAAPAPAPEAAKAIEENRKLARKLAVMEAKSMLLEAGREATEIRIKSVANAEESDRKSLVDSFPAKESKGDGWQRSNRGERPDSSPGANDEEAPDSDYEAAYESKVKAARERITEAKKTRQPLRA